MATMVGRTGRALSPRRASIRWPTVPASISKTPISVAVARTVTIDAFGPGATLRSFTELTDGWFNAAYALTLDDGRRAVLKVAPPPSIAVMRYERDLARAEVAALELVRTVTGVPVPRVVWFDETCRRVASPLFVMDLLPGTSLHAVRGTLDDERRAVVDAQVAAYLREMNAITGDAFGLFSPTQPRHPTWPDAFASLVDMVLADAADTATPLPRPASELRALVDHGRSALAEVTTPSFVHGDLWDGNVLVDPTTGGVTGVFDLERALWGDPLMEVSFRTLTESPAFMAAYGRSMLDTPSAMHRRRLYNVYLFLVMIVEGAYRSYDDDALERWARTLLDGELAALEDGPAHG